MAGGLLRRGGRSLSQRSTAARVPTLHCGARVLRLAPVEEGPSEEWASSQCGWHHVPAVRHTVCLCLFMWSWLKSLGEYLKIRCFFLRAGYFFLFPCRP